MIVGRLLARGIGAGILAALLAFCFAKIVGEPQVALSIAFEQAQDAAAGHPPEPELVSRAVQASWGLLVAVLMCGAAYGGLFAIVFALAYQRLVHFTPRLTSLIVAGLGFLAFVLIPDLKYPPNPPAVGLEETIGVRTADYFVMVGISLCTVMISVLIGRALTQRLGRYNSTLIGVIVGCVVVGFATTFMPTINEVPKGFPGNVLWNFREAAIGMQLLLWGSMGVLFGYFSEHLLQKTSQNF